MCRTGSSLQYTGPRVVLAGLSSIYNPLSPPFSLTLDAILCTQHTNLMPLSGSLAYQKAILAKQNNFDLKRPLIQAFINRVHPLMSLPFKVMFESIHLCLYHSNQCLSPSTYVFTIQINVSVHPPMSLTFKSMVFRHFRFFNRYFNLYFHRIAFQQ